MTGGPPADQGGSAARRRRARLAALAGGLAVTVAACQPSPPGGQPSSPGDRPSSDQVRPGPGPATGAVERHLIKYGQDIPYPQEVAADPAAYTRLPFDGIVLRVPASVDIFSPRAVDGSALLRDVSELPADLGDLERNWVRIAMLDELDWSDDALWDGIAANSAALAEAMRESGDPYVGVWFDNEFYGEGSSPWNYGEGHDPWTFSATDGATPGLQPEEARDLVRRRGAQVMAAMADAWPGLEVMVLFGPWFSAPASSPGPAEAGLHWNDLAWVAELSGPFTLGMLDAADDRARVIDGGEFYDARSAADYRAFRVWQDGSFLEGDGGFLAPGLTPEDYDAAVSSALAVYDRDQLSGYEVLAPETVGELVRDALAETDEYVWLYTEEHEWGASASGKPPVPEEYVDAVRAARGG